MELQNIDINKIFEDLVNGQITREEADRWAYARIQEFDLNELSFVPESDEDLIWSAIQYLYGIDTKTSPNEYMHSIDDIKLDYLSNWKAR